jgi:DHA2 family multidrug resistance protein-like MFS transporter
MQDSALTKAGPQASRREWIGLAVLALPALVIALDFSVLNLAVPVISRDLMPTATQLLWSVDIYGFILAGFLVTMGTLGDRIGRRRLLMIGAASFGIASVAAAYSMSAGMLIGARAVLGLAGATLMPSTLSLISNMFRDRKQRTLAIAVWSTSLPLGGAIGPLVGGAMLQAFWWGSVFLLAVPVMAVLLVTGPVLLPEYRNAAAGRLDFLSVGLSLAAILPVIYGLKEIGQGGLRAGPAAAIVVGLLVGWGFVRRQRSLADPLVDLRLFGEPGFSAALGINTLVYFVILGVLLLISQYLQLVLGLSPLQAGLWMLPTMGGLIGGSLVTPLFLRWLRPASAMAAGLAVAAAGFGVLTQTASLGLAVVVCGSAVFGLGLAPVTNLVVGMVLGSVPPHRAGAASGLSETSTEFGGALGIAILGSIGTAVYRYRVTDHIPPGISGAAARAISGTLGGAATAAGHLPRQAAVMILGSARAAFTSGLSIVAGISAVIVAALAVVAAARLRRVSPPGPARPDRGSRCQSQADLFCVRKPRLKGQAGKQKARRPDSPPAEVCQISHPDPQLPGRRLLRLHRLAPDKP